jgi:hypothetical protein
MRDMLTHKSGLPAYGYDLLWAVGTNFTREQLFYKLRYLQPNEDLRAAWQYNNFMVMAAGYALGEIGGDTWEVIFCRIHRLNLAEFSVETNFVSPWYAQDISRLTRGHCCRFAMDFTS